MSAVRRRSPRGAYLDPYQAMNVLSDAVHSTLSLPGNVHVSSQLPSGTFG